MSRASRKLLVLNLAILMVLSLAIPVFAAPAGDSSASADSFTCSLAAGVENSSLEARTDALESAPSVDEGSSPALESLLQSEFPAAAMSAARPGDSGMSLSAAPYQVTVGGTTFSSGADASGSDWQYYAADTALVLNNYNGSEISAEGNLLIYVNGASTITAGSGKDGVYAKGFVGIRVNAGSSLVVTGGSSSGTYAFSGIFGYEVYLLSYGTANITGGSCSNSQGLGGEGIYSPYVTLEGWGITLNGGAGNYSGGAAVYGYVIKVNAECTIRGGSGSVYDGPAIYYTAPDSWVSAGHLGTCSFGPYNIRLITGGSSTDSCIQWKANCVEMFTYSQHTTLTGSIYNLLFSPKLYKLKLHHDGGTFNGVATDTNLQLTYRNSVFLDEYVFQKDGYTQVGWRQFVTSTDLIPLGEIHTFTTNAELWPYWEKTDPGDVVLVGLRQRWPDGSYYKKYTNTSVTLPVSLNEGEIPVSLLGWSTALNPESFTENYYVAGVWYESGTTVSPEENAPLVLYASTGDEGTYAVYHPGSGVPVSGGNMIVQGSYASAMNLQVYTLTEDNVAAPEGYALAGWSIDKNSTAVEYLPGETLSLSGVSITHLYAQWKPAEYETVLAEGVTAALIPIESCVRITMTDAWLQGNSVAQGLVALYDANNGRMLALGILTAESGEDLVFNVTYASDIEPVIQIFGLTEEYLPAAAHFKCPISELYPDETP